MDMNTSYSTVSRTGLEAYLERFKKGVFLLLTNRHSLAGLILLTPIILISILAPEIATHDPTATTGPSYGAPSAEHFFGTDHLGRDIFSRVVYGGRSSLALGLSATGLAVVVGLPLGIIAGYTGGRVDEVLMRLMDTVLSIPALLLALMIVAMLGSSLVNAVIAIGVVYIPGIARIARSSTLSITEEEYITAAEARGESGMYIWFREILPNAIYPVIVEASVKIGFAILMGASLSFLGLGIQPPTPDWGYMISTSRVHIWNSIWFWFWPSLFLALTILGFNLLGDGMRDALDPNVEGSNTL
ncbi:ABC transporter permease [Natronorubrum sp. FCH18a]|uniref:ABC transporter permease n=1 Tax=Natronorubrum sp. FCH18a TaxID=3447018 RepID=UPI003F50EB72